MAARMATTPVRVSPETRDALTRLRLRVGGEIGRNVTMAQAVSILVTIGQNHFPELVRIARGNDDGE
jgi:hypothetical protein